MKREQYNAKAYWLMKSEPEVYSIDDLKREEVGQWGDIRNYQVRNMIRDDIKPGDLALLYHSNAKDIGCVGVLEVVGEAYPDPSQFDTASHYYDARSSSENPRWRAFNVRFIEKFSRIVTLAEIKNDPALASMVVAQQGSRLSISPVRSEHFKRICQLAKKSVTA